MKNQKQWVKDTFDAAAPDYGKGGSAFFQHFGKGLVDFSQVPVGAHALDVAMGRGAVLLPLAHKVGLQGLVKGIDISPSMVNLSEKLLKENSLYWVHVQEMDAEQLEFADHTFDFVFCGFALFFFPSLGLALKEFKRVLKPNGRLVVSVWGQKPALTAWVVEEVKRFGLNKSLASTALHNGEILKKTLVEAGFGSIRIKEESKTFYHQSALAWWESLWSHGTRSLLENLSVSELSVLQKKAVIKAEETLSVKGVSEEMHAIFGMGQAS